MRSRSVRAGLLAALIKLLGRARLRRRIVALVQRLAHRDIGIGKPEELEVRIFLLVAFQVVQAFDQLVQSDKYSVTVTSSWGASPVAEIPNSSPWDKANDYYWRAVVPSLVSRLRAGDWVFLINDMADLSPEQASDDSTQRLRELEMGLARLSDRLAERGVGLAVLHGVPFAREADCEPALAAPQWFAPFGSPCRFFSKEQTLSRRARLNQILSSLRDQGKIAIVDLIDVFCPRKTCTYQASNGQTLYRDVYSHPSVEAARLSAPLIRDVLTAPNPSRRGAAERQAR